MFQINFQTGLLDLSILYGPDEKRAHEVRRFKFGLLKADQNSDTSYQEYPFFSSGSEKCPFGGIKVDHGTACFYSGSLNI